MIKQELQLRFRLKIGIFSLAMVAILAAMALYSLTVLTIRLPRLENRIFYAARISDGDKLAIDYRHSVEKTRVQGIFAFSSKSGLINLETRMESVGTGLPNTFYKRTKRQGDWIVVDEKKAPLPNIRFFYSQINQTMITVKQRVLDLKKLKSGSLLVIKVEHPSALKFLWWKISKASWPCQGDEYEEVH